ncbi:MAG: hypothetical protein GXY36_19835 [Chloroflexi bacterium]|nr:hypothetical protein [Chloroflexota bacterium]
MRRLTASLVLLVGAAALTGCTLTQRDLDDSVVVVTATLSRPIAVQVATLSPTPDIPTPGEPSATPEPTATTEPITVASPIPSEAPTSTIEPPATAVLAASPTLVAPAGPPTVVPLDDGSGGIVPGTGDQSRVMPVEGVDALPEVLYYLSDRDGTIQLWRLRVGLPEPEQITFSPSGVAAFDVATNGAYAYITPEGRMTIEGVALLPDVGPGQPVPEVTALAWSPGAEWLAYTLVTPGADQGGGGAHPVDGLWIRNREGQTFLLEPGVYFDGSNAAAVRVYNGPIEWRPDGRVLLVGHDLADGRRGYSQVDVVSGAAALLWQEQTLELNAYETARWSVNGNAIITSGAGQVLRVEPNTLGVQVLVAPALGFQPENAQQFGNGTVTFTSGHDGAQRLYVLRPGENAPAAVSDDLTAAGRVDFLWDNFGEQTLLVVYEPGDSLLGTPYLRDVSGERGDLTALTGPVGQPRWGPLFRPRDAARVQTMQGESLNVRQAPGGPVLIQLATGARVTILGGPRLAEGYRWWWVQTADGMAGWAVESVTDPTGRRLRTLLPMP